jgi:uncharacterized protein (DUF1501 family)
MILRRDFLKAAGLGIAATGLPGVAFAQAETDARLVLVILRGAVDGLAIAAPYGDGNYSKMRGELALPAPGKKNGLLKLDGLFALHPALPGLHGDYLGGDALIVHAVASPYRERSHFDGQDVLENGGTSAGAIRDGWLNRAIAPLGGALGSETAIAMARNTPLVLRGDNSVTSWAPSQLPDAEDTTISRLQDLYADDAFFATRLTQALKAQGIAADMSGLANKTRRGNDAAYLRMLMESTARFLTAEDGPKIAVLEAGGWDTHANQGAGTGALANRLSGLDDGITALRSGLGESWNNTVVAVVTEFGRTVRVNGTRGTDHGTGTAAILTGGAVNGGRIIADWPGLAAGNLYQDRDLRATTDIRSLFKAILADHLELPNTLIESQVFPDSAAAKPIPDLISV